MGKQSKVPMKIVRACALSIALLSGPAFAQMPDINLLPDDPTKTPEQIEHDKAVERAYKDSLRKIPDAATSNDPWGAVRSDGAPKAKSKPKTSHVSAKPKTNPAAN